jgi:hypothetical protein
MWRPILLLAVLTGTTPFARADGDVAMAGVPRMLWTIELLIPDARFEHSFTADDDRFVLSVPVAMRAGHVGIGSASGILFNHFGEVQYQVTHREFRAVLGERMLMHGAQPPPDLTGVMPFLEAGALIGSDGSGAMAGGGLAWGDGMAGAAVGVVVRFVVTNVDRRGDVACDFQIPFNVL